MKLKFTAILFLLSISAKAQLDNTTTTSPSNQEFIPIRIAYFGNLAVNPGLKLGVDWNLSEIRISKTKKRKEKITLISKQLILSGNTAFYIHPTTTTGWFTAVELGRKRTKNDRWFCEPKLGIGLLTKFNSGETWEVDANGTVTNVNKTSRSYLAPSLAFGFGRNIMINDKKYAPYINLQSYAALGLNSGSIPDLALEIGLTFQPTVLLHKNLHRITTRNK